MDEVLLHSDPFQLGTDYGALSSGGFSLARNEIGILHALSSEKAAEFLYLISGLYNKRVLTKPARKGTLIREEIKVLVEDLSFLRFGANLLYEFSKDNVARARKIGFIFENPELFIMGNTVIEEFRYGFAAAGKSPLPSQALERYGFGDNKILRQTEFLSGGEHHRLNCAAVLELKPDLLVADFSSSNLDPEFTTALINWLEDLALQGSSIFLTGLHPTRFRRLIPKSYVLENGVFSQRPPAQGLFPDSAEERQSLSSLLKPRDVGTSNVLEVKSVGVPMITSPVSLNLRERELLILNGPNGSGKTTLGKILTKRMKRGFTGSFWPNDARPVMSLQYPDRSFVMTRVIDALPNRELLDMCGITEDQDLVHPRRLPRSQQKLLAVAITLSLSSTYAILDEPTSGMDFPSKKRFISLLNYFADKGILMITHDEAISFDGMTREWVDLISG